MGRVREAAALGLCLLAGCTRGATTESTPVLLAAPPMLREDCVRARDAYVAAREALNFCTRHDECAEVVPAACLGSYYVNVATGDRSLGAAEQDLVARCGVLPVCPRAGRGAPRCVRGRCTYVRRWNESAVGPYNFDRVLVPEYDQPYVVLTNRPAKGTLPGEIRVKVVAAGELTLRVDMTGCAGEFAVVHRGYGDVRHARSGRVETLRLFVSVDAEFSAWIDTDDPNCTRGTITAHLERQDRAPARSRHHGVLYERYGPD